MWRPWKEGREGESVGRVGKGEETVGGGGTEVPLKELTGCQGARKGRRVPAARQGTLHLTPEGRE